MHQIFLAAVAGLIIFLLALGGIDPFPKTKSQGIYSSGKEAVVQIVDFSKKFAANAKNNLEGTSPQSKPSEKTLVVSPDGAGVLSLTMTNRSSERVTYKMKDGTVKRILDPGEEFDLEIRPNEKGRYDEVIRITAYHHISKVTEEMLYYPATGKTTTRKL